MSLREQNLTFAFLKAVADAVEAELRRMRDDHTATLVEEWREEGSKSWNVRLPGGPKVATITLSEPKATSTVVDEVAFLEWCEANRSDAVETATTPAIPAVEAVPARSYRRVAPKAQTALLAGFKPIPSGDLVDPDTGSLVDGVKHAPAGEPKSFSVRYETDGRDALALAYRAGELDHLASGSVLPQIGGRP